MMIVMMVMIEMVILKIASPGLEIHEWFEVYPPYAWEVSPLRRASRSWGWSLSLRRTPNWHPPVESQQEWDGWRSSNWSNMIEPFFSDMMEPSCLIFTLSISLRIFVSENLLAFQEFGARTANLITYEDDEVWQADTAESFKAYAEELAVGGWSGDHLSFAARSWSFPVTISVPFSFWPPFKKDFQTPLKGEKSKSMPDQHRC